jgi:hypothetical protein
MPKCLCLQRDPSLREPQSAAQIGTTRVHLGAMECEAQEIARLMYEGYGADDRRAIRAGEMLASIQRLRWELDPDPQQGPPFSRNVRS